MQLHIWYAVKVDNRVTFSKYRKNYFWENGFEFNHDKLVDLHELMNVAEIPNQLSDDIQKCSGRIFGKCCRKSIDVLLEFPYGHVFCTNEHLRF